MGIRRHEFLRGPGSGRELSVFRPSRPTNQRAHWNRCSALRFQPLTLYISPVIYYYLDQTQEWTRPRLGRLHRRPEMG